MKQISKEILEQIRQEYPIGSRVELEQMDDKQAPPRGTQGIVRRVDDIGSIHVAWETGGSLAVVYGEDKCKRVELEYVPTQEEIAMTINEYLINIEKLLIENAELKAQLKYETNRHHYYKHEYFSECDLREELQKQLQVEEKYEEEELEDVPSQEEIAAHEYLKDVELDSDDKFRYQMLGRLQNDCEFYLDVGDRNPTKLWASEESKHIEIMKNIYNSFPDNMKPEWISMEDICNYENAMLSHKKETSNEMEMEM